MKTRIFTTEEQRKLDRAKKTALARDLVTKFELINGGHKVKITFTTGKPLIHDVEDFLI